MPVTKKNTQNDIHFLKSLPFEKRAFYSRWFSRLTFENHDIVFYQDDCDCHFYEIFSGQVKISKYTADGKEITIEILRAGDRFGFVPLIDDGGCECTATALGDTVLFAISKADFEVVLKKYPHLMDVVLEDSCSRIRSSYDQLENLASGGSKSRIARLLLEMARQEGKPDKENRLTFKIRLTHQELANLAGASRETATRVISFLKKKEYIKVKRSTVTIIDEEGLEEYIYSSP